MARALECPACGHRHRLDSLPTSGTFRCEQCGQVLKAPASVSSAPGAPPPPARRGGPPSATAAAGAEAATAAAAPSRPATGAPPSATPPRRRTAAPAGQERGTSGAPVRTAAAVSATVSTTGRATDDNGSTGAKRRSTPAPSAPAPVRTKVHWYWRVLAWIAAVPLAFVVTAWPAYKLGFIKKDDLLDIFVGTGIGRYVRLAVVTLVWAVVTALLVQLFVEGGRAWSKRRRRTRAAAA